MSDVYPASGPASPKQPRRLRITMLLENNPYPVDPRVRSEAEALAADGHEVRVIAPSSGDEPRHEVVRGVTVERFHLKFIHSGSRSRLLSEYALAHLQLYWRGIRALIRGTDVLHAHNPPDTLFPLGLLGRALGSRFVFDQHDLFPDLVAEKFTSRTLAGAARLARRMSLRAADLVITTNPDQRDRALSEKAGDELSVITVRNGLPGRWLDHESSSRKGPLRDPRLLYIGVLEPQDGIGSLPEILSRLVRDHALEAAHLTIVGTGSRSGPLMAQVEELGLTRNVEFTGFLAHDRAMAAIAEADICLDVAPCTSFNHQSTMIKIIEYLTLRKAVVSFPLRETQRLAGDAVAYAACDDIADFARLVAHLAEDEQLRSSLEGRARAIAPSLVWERSAEKLLAGYRRL